MHTLSLKLLVIVPVFLLSCSSKNTGNTESTTNVLTDNNKQYQLVEAYNNLTFDLPLEMVGAGDGSKTVYVVEQKGVIKALADNETAVAPVFLEIQNKVVSGGEKGLLGLAFHPDFKNNGYFFVNYTRDNPLTTVIARYKVNGSKADVASEQILLTYEQPFGNHNGGKIAFGADGMLYIAAGDGGSGGDPGNRAQNRRELLGKILRIDVDNTSAGKPYAIPADNPYANNNQGFKEEIFAYGLRNPWRFNFDKQTNMLWVGDVGQNKIEEIDIVEKGGNYGWNIMEAENCFKTDNCDTAGLIQPITSYQQDSNTGRSVTGGYVCRDENLPGLNGKYIYGDFVSGNIWALTYNGKQAVKNQQIGTLKGGLSSFGEDNQQHLYILAYGSGKIYRLSEK